MKKIILASGSPRRRELLTQIGISFEVVKAEGEEKITTDDPEEAVKELAMQKAQEVAGRVDADVVIGADTVVAVDGEIMGKPKDPEDAVRMIHRIQGRDHEVLTGVAVILKKGEVETTINFAETTRVHVFPMTEEEIRAYMQQAKNPWIRPGHTASRGSLLRMYLVLKGITTMWLVCRWEDCIRK